MRDVYAIAFALLLVTPVFAQQTSGRQILGNVERTFAPLNDFSASFEADVNMEGLRMPRAQGKIYFKRPDKLAIESASFALVPREGFFFNPEILSQKYDVVAVGNDTINACVCVKLQLAAKDEITRLRQLFLWVDTLRWYIVRMETVPAQGRTMTIAYEYTSVEGIPLLAGVVMDVRATNIEQPDRLLEASPDFAPRTDRLRRAVQQGTIKITFSNHVVNAGIPDQQFERSPAQEVGKLKE